MSDLCGHVKAVMKNAKTLGELNSYMRDLPCPQRTVEMNGLRICPLHDAAVIRTMRINGKGVAS